MGSTHRCSALETQTSAGAQTKVVMKFLAHIDGERRNVQLKASESIFTLRIEFNASDITSATA